MLVYGLYHVPTVTVIIVVVKLDQTLYYHTSIKPPTAYHADSCG